MTARTYTGKPCPKGHALRYVANRKCIACALADQAARYDRTAQTAAKRAYRARMKETSN